MISDKSLKSEIVNSMPGASSTFSIVTSIKFLEKRYFVSLILYPGVLPVWFLTSTDKENKCKRRKDATLREYFRRAIVL